MQNKKPHSIQVVGCTVRKLFECTTPIAKMVDIYPLLTMAIADHLTSSHSLARKIAERGVHLPIMCPANPQVQTKVRKFRQNASRCRNFFQQAEVEGKPEPSSPETCKRATNFCQNATNSSEEPDCEKCVSSGLTCVKSQGRYFFPFCVLGLAAALNC